MAFGHGNFQDRTEGLDLDSSGNCGLEGAVPCREAHSRMYDTYGFVYFATDMLGMGRTDYDTTIPIMLLDLSLFPWLSDYLHQGMLNRLLATRSMLRQFGTHPEIIDLGIIKGNIGDQNYEIPAEVDIDEIGTISIWCKRFGVNFGAATIS